MTRIDLRNRALSAAQLRAALPRGGVDVETVLPKVRPIVRRSRSAAPRRPWNTASRSTGCGPTTVRVPAARTGRRAGRAGFRRARRAGGGDRARPGRARRPAPHRHHDDAGPGATVTERWVPVERVGLYVPGGNAVYPSSVVMNVVPAQTAGVDSLVIASPPQARVRRPAAPDDPRRRPPARRRRGVGGRRRTGRRAAGLRRHRHRRRRAGAGRHDHRSRQHLRHRRQADLPLAGRHRRRGGADRDRDPRRPHRRSRRTSPPT